MARKRVMQKRLKCGSTCVYSIFKLVVKGTQYRILLTGSDGPPAPEPGRSRLMFVSNIPIIAASR